MGASKTLLDELRSHTLVDCDTLDCHVAERLGPFVDCTSNQAIAFNEISTPENAVIVSESVKLAQRLLDQYNGVQLPQLAVEIMMVRMSSRMTKHITGFAHIQTNPYYSYSKDETVAAAERIVSLFKRIDRDFPSSRVCIKIPSTWEGLQACRELERRGIHTLATTLFCMDQAALAADAGCTYIAPYVNELLVHFSPGASHMDTAKGFPLCRTAQKYYKRIGAKTQVLPASLVSTAEVMKLAGAHHITVSPPLLDQLASLPASSSFSGDATSAPPVLWMDEDDPDAEVDLKRDWAAVVGSEQAWRTAFTLRQSGAAETKLVQAINIFARMQDSLEELAKKPMIR